MNKKAYFYIDDVIWLFRDLTRENPESIYDNAFLKMLKTAHDKYGMKVQLNVFYRTDFYYGDDEFTLKDMTDKYKKEFEMASDWLKFGFHSKQEFPDYPYINADYKDVEANLSAIKNEIFRFAGEKSFAHACVPHWLPISKDGCRALADGGIRLLAVSAGEQREYNGDPFSLPYGHAQRLINNRKPETKVFSRNTADVAINNSLCGYNHISDEQCKKIKYNFDYIKDEETGICLKTLHNGLCLNLHSVEELKEYYTKVKEREYMGYGVHEQYFYKDYLAYQPDYAEKLYVAAKALWENGYTYFFVEELV